MRKIPIFLITFLSLAAVVFGETTESVPIRRISFNWSVGFDGQPEVFTRSSVIGFGYLLYNNGQTDIRNQLSFYNGVMIMEESGKKNYKKVLAEKISFGRMTRGGLFRPYGFIEARFGWCGEEKWVTFENPIIWNFGLGTGLDIFVDDRWCYFIELGFLENLYEDEFIPQQRFELGMKWMF